MTALTIAGRELRSLFLSPLAWSILAVVTAICAWFFLAYVDLFLQIQPRLAANPGGPGVSDIVVAPLFATAATVLLLVTPLITMRLVSEERRAQTLPLLLSAPVSMSEIVLGKFLGALGFVYLMLALVGAMPLSLLAGGDIDLGLWAAGLLALALVLSCFCSIGLYLSTLTAQPVVAAISTFGLLLLLWVLDITSSQLGEQGVLHYLALSAHYQPLLRGIVDSADIAYFLLLTVTFLVLSIRRLDAERLPH